MNEQEQMSQLSALFDNQLPPAEAELVIRRALKDPALRARWDRYALIGACVRNEPLRAAQPDVAERVRKQLAAETEVPHVGSVEVARYPGERRGWLQFGRGALGGAIAAGVAAMALIVMHSMGSQANNQIVQIAEAAVPAPVTGATQPESAAPQVQAQALVAAADVPPDLTPTPVNNSAQRNSGPFANIVVAHSDVAASGRLLPLSAATNGYDITQGTVQMTEADIRNYR